MANADEQADAPEPPVERDGWRRNAPLGVLAGVAAVLPPLGGFALLGFMGRIGPWLAAQGAAGVAVFVVGFVVLAGLALLPTYAQAVLAGFAFGWAVGIPAALAGFTGAAALGYLVARRTAGDRLSEVVDGHPRWGLLRHALLRGEVVNGVAPAHSFARVTGMVALLRLPPNAPFSLSNVAFAGLAVPWRPYVLGTLLGMAPRTAVAVVLGAGIADLDGSDLGASLPFAWGLGVTVVVMVVLSVIAKRTLAKLEAAAEGAASGGA